MKAGADTVVLEVAPKELRGGNSGVCGGGWICPTDVQGYADFLYRLNLQRDDKQELLEFSQTLSGMVDWIEELGIDYMDTKRAGFNFYPKEFHEMAPTMNNSLKGVSETGMEHHAMADADGNQAKAEVAYNDAVTVTVELQGNLTEKGLYVGGRLYGVGASFTMHFGKATIYASVSGVSEAA